MVGGGSSLSVNIVGGSVIDVVVSPTNAVAVYLLNADGTETSTPAGISNTWLLGGAASSAEVRATVTAGATTAGDVTGAWLGLGVNRSWRCGLVNDAAGVASASLTIEVRNASTLAVLDTAPVDLYAEVTA